MKLALVRRSFSAAGGAELYLQRLLAALGQAGHELHLFAERWSDVPAGVSFHPIAAGGTRAARPRLFAEEVRRAVGMDRYDCVFSLERTLRQDVYRAGDGVHRVWLERRREFGPWWRKFWTGRFHRTMLALEKETFDAANTRFVIVNSEMVRREIQRHFSFPAQRIVLVRNGVDVPRFRGGDRSGSRARFGFGEEDFVCLFAGSGWERKGLRYVVEAIRTLGPQVKLLVAGKGRPFAAGPQVTFTGAVNDLENLYAAADLFTFVPIYEPSANVCIEALAAGLPVITSVQNGAAEFITSAERGYVVSNPADVGEIAREISRRAGQRRRIQVPDEEISLERNVRETLEVLERAAGTR
jgi:UDP-glucose:(heptosyl)LPS alpha-1,3-glucosyltransferase